MTEGLAPFSARQLVDWLKSKGCTFVTQNGSHTVWQTETGRKFGCTDPAGSRHPVTMDTAKKAAVAHNMNYAALAAELGYTAKRGGTKTRAASKSLVTIHVPPLADIALALNSDVVDILKSGQCRKASPLASAELLRYAAQVKAWKERNSTPPPKPTRPRAA